MCICVVEGICGYEIVRSGTSEAYGISAELLEVLEAEIGSYMGELGLYKLYKEFLTLQSFLETVTGDAASNIGRLVHHYAEVAG